MNTELVQSLDGDKHLGKSKKSPLHSPSKPKNIYEEYPMEYIPEDPEEWEEYRITTKDSNNRIRMIDPTNTITIVDAENKYIPPNELDENFLKAELDRNAQSILGRFEQDQVSHWAQPDWDTSLNPDQAQEEAEKLESIQQTIEDNTMHGGLMQMIKKSKRKNKFFDQQYDVPGSGPVIAREIHDGDQKSVGDFELESPLVIIEEEMEESKADKYRSDQPRMGVLPEHKFSFSCPPKPKDSDRDLTVPDEYDASGGNSGGSSPRLPELVIEGPSGQGYQKMSSPSFQIKSYENQGVGKKK